MRRQTLIIVNAHSVRFRLTVSARRIKLRVQNQQWIRCPQGRFRIPRTFPEYTARQAKPDARTLTLAENAFAVHVASGKNMISKMQIRIIISVSTAEQPDLLFGG
jgi:hypothetical protein